MCLIIVLVYTYIITMTPHERIGVPNYLHLERLFSGLFGLITKEITNLCIDLHCISAFDFVR